MLLSVGGVGLANCTLKSCKLWSGLSESTEKDCRAVLYKIRSDQCPNIIHA